MHILTGTSGWSYKEWKGIFYPADLPADGMLRYYATRLPSVEINNSFYRIPKETVLLEWAAQVPAGFRFVLKASRRITHINRLANEDGSLEYFLRTVNVLGERLGPTLFQCPPSLRKDMSGYTDDDVFARSLLPEEAPFIQKPFGPEELVAKVRTMLSQ